MAVTLLTLRDLAKARVGLEAFSGPVGDTQWTGYANKRGRELHGLLVAAQLLPLASTDITANGAASYSLTTALAIEEVLYIEGETETPLHRIMPRERSRVRFPNGGGPAEFYEVRGTSLYLLPKPGSGLYRVWYVAMWVNLTADGDTVEGYNGWEDYIVDGMARDAALKEGDIGLARELKGEMDATKLRIQQEARLRNLTQPPRIVDVRPRNSQVRDAFSFRAGRPFP
jgi:hypothetical protein